MDLEVSTVMREVIEATLRPKKKTPRPGGSGDFEADYENFEADSGESDLDLGHSGVDEKDDDEEVIEIKPVAAIKNQSLFQGINPGLLGLVLNLCIITFSD